MPDVILVVSGRAERRDGLVAGANRLAALSGKGRVRLLSLVPFTAPELAVDVLDAGADVSAEVEARGGRADFIVVAQPGPDDDRATRAAFQAALLRSDRPVLMVPPKGAAATFGQRVAIGWRDDARTLKAVVPALRLLGRAEQLHLLAGVRAGVATPPMPPVLAEHGLTATLQVLAIDQGPFGELLLARARELGADLLVMGAYAHSPLREMLLGGLTRYVLAHADLPVLLRY